MSSRPRLQASPASTSSLEELVKLMIRIVYLPRAADYGAYKVQDAQNIVSVDRMYSLGDERNNLTAISSPFPLTLPVFGFFSFTCGQSGGHA